MTNNQDTITSREAFTFYKRALEAFYTAKNSGIKLTELGKAADAVESAWNRFAGAFIRENREYIAQDIIAKPRRPK